MAKKNTGVGWSLVSSDPVQPSHAAESRSSQKQRPTFALEKRKKGKVVTLIRNLALSESDLKDLSRALKTICGTGGTAHYDQIELQGDCRDRARSYLQKNGYDLK
jgi:translation initiation factor 1